MDEKTMEIMEDTHSDEETMWPEDLFSDTADTHAEEETEVIREEEKEHSENQELPEPETQKDDQDRPQTFTLKHLGKEQKVTLEELIALGQKGMDYDFLKQKNEELKNAEEVQMISRLAKEAGMTKEEYLSTVEKTLKDSKRTQRVQELIGTGMDEKSAGMVADLESQNKDLSQRLEALERPKMAAKADQQRVLQDLRQLITLFPEVKQLPDSVIQNIKEKGMMPTVAYQNYVIEHQNQTIQQLEKNISNAKKSTGSVKGEGTAEADPFLMGFNA